MAHFAVSQSLALSTTFLFVSSHFSAFLLDRFLSHVCLSSHMSVCLSVYLSVGLSAFPVRFFFSDCLSSYISVILAVVYQSIGKWAFLPFREKSINLSL